MPRRPIIKIDEELCTGCGECVPSCAEGALEIVDGKARVVSEVLCDGLGACLGECPEGALILEERPAPEFDEGAVEKRLEQLREGSPQTPVGDESPVSLGCPGSAVRDLRVAETASQERAENGSSQDSGTRGGESLLEHWPVQLGLANPMAPVYRGADLLITADCVPVAYRRFQEEFLEGRRIVMFCPKLDDAQAHLERLTELLATAKPKSVTILHMEVPCCFGLREIVLRAAEAANLEVPVEEVVIGVGGEVLSEVAGG